MAPDNSSPGTNLQFRFRKAANLRKKNGEAPNAAVYAKYTAESRKGKSSRTGWAKGFDPVWDENINLNMASDDKFSADTQFTFFVVDSSPLLPLSTTKIARSKPYTLDELFSIRDAVDPEKLREEGFVVPLESENKQTSGSPPSLWLNIKDFWSVADKIKYHSQVSSQWRSKNQQRFQDEIANARRDLMALAADLPATSNSKTIADIALGALNLVANISSIPQVNDDPAAADLLVAHCNALKHIREKGPHATPDAVVQLYGDVSCKIVSSLRTLSQLSALNLQQDPVYQKFLTQVSLETLWFDDFVKGKVQPTPDTLLQSSEVLALRKTKRKNLIPHETGLFSVIDPPPAAAHPTSHSFSQRSKSIVPPTAVQLVSSWAFSNPTQDTPPRVLWLYGPSNCGKTQLATRLVDAYAPLGVFPAYHSFNPQNPDSSDLDEGKAKEDALRAMAVSLGVQLAAYNDGNPLVKDLSGLLKSESEQTKLQNSDDTFEEVFAKLVLGPLSPAKQAPKAEDVAYRPKRLSGEAAEATGPYKPQNPVVLILDEIDQLSPAELDKLLLALFPSSSSSLEKLSPSTRILLLSRDLSSVHQALEATTGKLVVKSEFGTEEWAEGGGTPMSPVFSPIRASFGSSVNGHATSNGSGNANVNTSNGNGGSEGTAVSRSSSIRWSNGVGNSGDGSAGKGIASGAKGKRRVSASSVKSMNGITELLGIGGDKEKNGNGSKTPPMVAGEVKVNGSVAV